MEKTSISTAIFKHCVLGNGDDLDLTVVLPILVFRIPGMLEVANAA